MNKHQPDRASIEVAAFPVTPKQPANHSWNDERHHQHDIQVIAVLPLCDVVLPEIANICSTGFPTRLENDPPDVREQQPFVRVVRIEIGVGIAMVGTMTSGPPSDGALGSSCTCES